MTCLDRTETIWTPTRIKKLRGKLTQSKFSQILGCSITSLSQWELGNSVPSNAYQKLLDNYSETTKAEAMERGKSK